MTVGGVMGLTTAIDVLDCERADLAAGVELQQLLALRARLDAHIAERVGAFDASNEWSVDGSRSAAGWLVRHCRMAQGDAYRLVRTARHAREMPAVAQAWRAAEISSAHVDVLVRARHGAKADDRFAEFESVFVDVAKAGTPEDVAHVARQWRDALDAELDRRDAQAFAERQWAARYLHCSKVLDDALVIDGHADPESGSIIDEAIDRAYDTLHRQRDERTPAQQRLDALTHVCRQYLSNQAGGGNRPHVLVLVDEPTLAGEAVGLVSTDSGVRLSPAAAHRIACDAFVSEARVDPATSAVLDLGRAKRTFTPEQYRAIVAQYPTCVGLGCHVPASECTLHHIDWWTRGGFTDLANGAPVCAHDHRLLHEHGWRIERDYETGVITWFMRDGTVAGTSEPRGPTRRIPIRDDLAEMARARARALKVA
jgi:hypothetical protein